MANRLPCYRKPGCLSTPLPSNRYRSPRAITTQMSNWVPSVQLENVSALLWARFWATDYSVSTGGARQFYSADKTSLQHTDSTFFQTGDIPLYWCGWVYFNNIAPAGSVRTIASKNDYSTNGKKQWELYYYTASGKMELAVSGDGTTWTTAGAVSAVTIAVNTWYFVQWWHDPTANMISISVNMETPVTAAITTGIYSGTANYTLGARANSDTYQDYHYGRLSCSALLKNTAARAVIDSAATQTEMYNLGRGILSGNLDLLLADLGTFTAGVDWDAWNLNETDGTADARSFSGLNDLTPTFGELVTNGTFDSDLTGWTARGGGYNWDTYEWSAGRMHLVEADGLPGHAQQNQSVPCVSGHRYKLSYAVDFISGNTIWVSYFDSSSTVVQGYDQAHAVDTTVTDSIFTATATNGLISFAAWYSSISEWYVDNVSLKAVDIPACDGPSSDIAPDTGSVGTAHGLLTNFADSETARSTDTADGSPNPTVEDQAGTYNGLMVDFASPDTARSAHGLTGVPGKAITFAGAGNTDNIVVGKTSSFDIAANGDVTLSAWIYSTSSSGYQTVLTKRVDISANTNYEFGLSASGGANKLYFYATSNGPDLSTDTIPLNTWAHIAVVVNSAGTTFYINGAANGTGSAKVAASNATDVVRIGACYSTDTHTQSFIGKIADPRIYTAELSAANVAAIAAGDSGLTGSPVLRYDFNEADTRSLPTIGSGTSLVFDGTDDRVTLGSASFADITTEDFTIDVWIKPDVVTNDGAYARRIICKQQSDSVSGWGLTLNNGVAGLWLDDALFEFGTALTAGAWSHVLVSVDRSGLATCYVNGTSFGTHDVSAKSGSVTSISTLTIGRLSFSANGHFDGQIDELRIYLTALSGAQAAQRYAATEATGATPIHHWTFDEQTSLSVTDGDPIATATSLEGSRYQFLNAMASERPEVVKVGLNGKQGLRFDSIDDMLVYVGTILSGTSGSTYLIYTLEEVPNAYQTILAQSDTATATKYVAFHARGNTANPHIGYEQVNADTVDLLDGSTEVTDNLHCAVYWDCDGTTHRAWLNGVAQTLNADTGANNGDLYDDTTGEDVVSIGGLKHTSTTNHAGVVLYELYSHPLKLTDASRAKIAAYVLREYGLTL